VLLYNSNWRYILDGFPDVSYAEAELKPAKETEEKWEIKKIIGVRMVKKQMEYQIWWKRFKKDESTWESKAKLLEDIGEEALNDYIKEYKNSLKPKKKVKK
jgi:hypothetical protein